MLRLNSYIASGAIAILLACHANKATAEDVFESYVGTNRISVLPSALLNSEYYRISHNVEAKDNFYHFKIRSDYGNYRVSSVAMLRKRIHELVTIAQVMPQILDKGMTLNRAPGGQRGVDAEYVGDILIEPLSTASKLLDNLVHNFDQTFGEAKKKPPPSPESPAPTAAIPDPDPHKRSAASQLSVDVYSRNRELQAIINLMAKARSSGRLRDSVAPILHEAYQPVMFGTGVFNARLKSILKNESAADVNQRVANIFAQHGVNDALRIQFLTHPAYSPKSRLYFARYLDLIDTLPDFSPLVLTALAATTPGDALTSVTLARMLAFYHLSGGGLRELIGGGAYPTIKNHAGVFIIPLPLDYLDWSQSSALMLSALDEANRKYGSPGVKILLAGHLTERATLEFTNRPGIEVLSRYSF